MPSRAFAQAPVRPTVAPGERQIAAIDAELHVLCRADTELKARLDILVSIPGISEATALTMLTMLTMLIEMPDLGAIKNKCIDSLSGLAPT